MDVAIIAFACAAVALWCAHSGGHSALGRSKLRWAAACFLALGLGGAYLYALERKSSDEVAQFVPPYPKAVVRSRSPIVVEGTRGWVFETSDAPTRVAAFYGDVARTNHWRLTRRSTSDVESLTFERQQNIATIVIAPRAGKTEITYLVRARQPNQSY
jgi:hypothetical protein